MSTIAENLQTIATAKADIATSVNAKGGNITSSTPLSAYSAAIDALPSGGSGGTDLDWSEIGYSARPSSIDDAYDYAKDIYDNWDDSETDLSNKYLDDKELTYFPLVDTSNAENMNSMFANCDYLNTVPLLDTSNVENMGDMFESCMNIKTIPQFNTSACTDMSWMFNSCFKLESIPVFDTSNVTDMNCMFQYCESLTDIPTLNTSGVTNMTCMFNSCQSLTGFTALSNYDFQSVEDCGDMFSDIEDLPITNLPVMNSSACTNFSGFLRCGTTALTRVEGIYLNAWGGGNIFGDWSGDPDDGSNHPNLTYVILYNLGMSDSVDQDFDLSCLMDWGDGGSTNHQSLIDSLYTNAFDRATEGYDPVRILLHPYVYARLSQSEIDDIESKGYEVVDISQE